VLLSARLIAQSIIGSIFSTPEEVLCRLLAVQGQDYAGAKWSLGLRAPGCTDSDVEQAYADGKFIRTWAMRGTLHLVNARDVHWLLALLGPKIIAGSARRYRELELDDAALKRSSHLIVQALSEASPLNRQALAAALEQAGISMAGQRAPYILAYAALTGLIYQSAVVRNDPFYRLLPPPVGLLLEREEALAELARRYFTSRGPATLADFVWWSGLSTSDARAGLHSIRGQLFREQLAGGEYWHLPHNVAHSVQASDVVLLPGFDEYVLSYKDRRAILDVEYIKRMTPKNGMLPPTIVINGLVCGVWKRVIDKRAVKITASPSAPLTAEQRASLAAAAERFGAFLQMPVILNIED